MEPVITSSKKLIQIIITIILGLILLALVGAYLYVGIQRAKVADVTTQATDVAGATASAEEVTNPEAREINRRTKILNELVAESISTTTITEREAVLEQLVKESDPVTVSEDDRWNQLNALQNTPEENSPELP